MACAVVLFAYYVSCVSCVSRRNMHNMEFHVSVHKTMHAPFGAPS